MLVEGEHRLVAIHQQVRRDLWRHPAAREQGGQRAEAIGAMVEGEADLLAGPLPDRLRGSEVAQEVAP